jgi:zinc transport system permease protein
MTTIITDLPDFFIRALMAGALISCLTGPLGCLLVWRRMAFFGDALAHAALLGVALALALSLPVFAGVLVLGVIFALGLALLTLRGDLGNDTLLGILSPSALALGLIALSLLPGVRVDLTGYLFGDILSLTQTQIWLIAGGTVGAVAVLALLWRALLQLTVAPDLAAVAGQPMRRLELAFLVLLALLVALGVQLVGVLLLTALLIIPAASARPFARTPEQMAVIAAGLGALSCITGLFASLYMDLPAGPTVVVAAFVIFTLARLQRR